MYNLAPILYIYTVCVKQVLQPIVFCGILSALPKPIIIYIMNKAVQLQIDKTLEAVLLSLGFSLDEIAVFAQDKKVVEELMYIYNLRS